MTSTPLTQAPERPASPNPAVVARPPWLDPLAVTAVLALTSGLIVAALPPEVRLAAALVVFVMLPGHLLVQTVFEPGRPGPLVRWLLALGAATSWRPYSCWRSTGCSGRFTRPNCWPGRSS